MNLPLDEDLLRLAIGNMDCHTIYEGGGVAVGSGQNSIHPRWRTRKSHFRLTLLYSKLFLLHINKWGGSMPIIKLVTEESQGPVIRGIITLGRSASGG